MAVFPKITFMTSHDRKCVGGPRNIHDDIMHKFYINLNSCIMVTNWKMSLFFGLGRVYI